MKKLDGAVAYEDFTSGDTFNEFDDNQNREEYFETVLDYLRTPEHRVLVEDNPQEPEVVKKLKEVWNPEIGKEFTPSNKEENAEKIKLFWAIGKLIAEFYAETGHQRRTCPQCGYATLENVEDCGKSASRRYNGCGHKFEWVRDRGYSEESALEKGIGSKASNYQIYASPSEEILVAHKSKKEARKQAEREGYNPTDLREATDSDIENSKLKDGSWEVVDGDFPDFTHEKRDGSHLKIREVELKEKFGEEPVLEDIHYWKTVRKFKQFYWFFPNGSVEDDPDAEFGDAGYYTPEMSWSANFDYASFYNFPHIVMPLYWQFAEEYREKRDSVDDIGQLQKREKRRKLVRERIEEFAEKPREMYLTNPEIRKYSEPYK